MAGKGWLLVVCVALVMGSMPCMAEYLDLTWTMDMDKISWHPTFDADIYQYKHNLTQYGAIGQIPFLAFGAWSIGEHMGTHVDAPFHLYEPGKKIDEVPLKDLMGPLVIIDIRDRIDTARNPDEIITVQDFLDWEAKHGEIPERSFLFMLSGWDKYWGNNGKFVGTDFGTDGIPHSPGFSTEAAQWLVDNKKATLGLGVDTLGCDTGDNPAAEVHQIILPAGMLCVENVRSLDKVPASGSHVSVLPLKLKGGSGAQARVFAVWGDDLITAGVGKPGWSTILVVAMAAVLGNIFG